MYHIEDNCEIFLIANYTDRDHYLLKIVMDNLYKEESIIFKDSHRNIKKLTQDTIDYWRKLVDDQIEPHIMRLKLLYS